MSTTVALSYPPPERNFLPADFDATDTAQIDARFDELLQRPLDDVDALLAWIADADELVAALSAVESRCRIAASVDTTDTAAREALIDFQTRVIPVRRRGTAALDHRFVDCPLRAGLDPAAWGVFDRDKRADQELFREANVALETEESRLALRYDELMGALTVSFRGEQYTPQAMARFLEESDRDTRKEAWIASSNARLAVSDEVQTVLDQLLSLRGEMAANADCVDYREFRFRQLHRFDYGPAECETFHAAVEQHVVPAVSALRERRRRALGVDQLCPWDLAVDPEGRPPLRPFNDVNELSDMCQTAFTRVDPELGAQFAFMREHDLLDLANRPGKAPGGYQATPADTRLPFIFANAVGLLRDVRTLLHEGGHAFHALACRDQPVAEYRHAPIEFCEVASMSMELLAAEQLEAVMSSEDAARARSQQLQRSLEILPWVATIDAFQHWLYTHPGHDHDERRAAWVALRERFEPGLDWSGQQAWYGLEWQSQLHLYRVPFYYIEYGIAQVGALQVWLNWRNKGAPALAAWREALALGGSRPLPELFTAAHVCFDFGPAMLKTLCAAVMESIDECEAELAQADPA
ncbi:MAG: M3 family oligoendopeptidase [Planctomycetota bacterium]|jgi:oligoendopeptidase F